MNNPFALVIEDEKDLSRLFAHVIRMAGFETEQVMDGQAALNLVENTTPDVVILDLHLPYISGKVVLEKIRKDERLSHTQVVLVTGDILMADTLAEYFNFVLLKPINFTQLQNLAQRLYYTINESKAYA